MRQWQALGGGLLVAGEQYACDVADTYGVQVASP